MISQSDLEQLFKTDRTAKFTSLRGTFTVKYYSDGRQEVSYAQGTDTGNFRIQDDQFCSHWKISRAGEEVCVKFYKVSENKYELIRKDGSLGGTLEF